MTDLKAFNSSSYDAYTRSSTPTANYNGGSQSDGSVYLDRAGLHPGVAEFNTHIKFDLGQYAGRQVINATFNSHVFSEENGTAPLCMYPIAANNAWDPNSVTWNTRPNHWGDCNNVSDPNKLRVVPAIGDNAFDITTWVANWSSGAWQNNGMTLDTAGLAGHFKIGAFEQFTNVFPYPGHYPYIRLTYNTLPTPSNPTEPLDNERVMSVTPTLKATTATDADPNDPVKYWFRLSTTSDPELGQVTNSGWLDNPQWQVPDGALQDGATYSWYVFSKDPQSLNGAYTVSQHKWKFRVNKGFGVQGAAPNDTVGPLNVNLANGNVTTEISSPMMKTVGGDIGVKYSYNSKDTNKFGLKGQYFDGCANGQNFDEVRVTRTDTQIDMHWDQTSVPSQLYPGIDQWQSSSGSPAPGVYHDDFCVRWNGYVTVPSQGTWCFDVVSDDGVRLKFDDSQNWLFQRWNTGATHNADFTNKCVTFDAGRTKKVLIEHFESGGGAHAVLYAAPSDNLGAKTIVPASWLSTATDVLPEGWRLSIDTDTGVQYSRATVGNRSITLHEPNGAAHEYIQSSGVATEQNRLGFIPPPEERSTITKRADNSYVVDAEDGLKYEFNKSGALTDVRSKADATKPAAAVMHYDGTGRLLSLQDPVSLRQVEFTYGKADSEASCPNPSNTAFKRAPVGQLCKIKYWDNTETTLLYTDGDPAQLARIVDPGGEVTDLGYVPVDTDPGTVANNKLMLNRISDPVVEDWIADDVSRDNVTMRDDVSTKVTYAADGNFKATQVDRPFPNPANKAGQPRPSHAFAYGASRTATVKVAGTSSNLNHFDAAYTWDIGGRTTQGTDGAGITTVSGYDKFDQPTFTKNLQTNRMAASSFDVEGRVTHSYGPAPASCFDTANPPNRVAVGAGCGATEVPHTSTKYDSGFANGTNGLSASYWNNTNFTGMPVKHEYFTSNTGGKLQHSWGSGAPTNVPADNWAGRFTGRIALDSGSTYTFSEAVDDGVRVYVDDRLVFSHWPNETPPTPVTITAASANDGPKRSERIRIDYVEVTGGATLGVKWSVNGGTADFIPLAALVPNFGLPTETLTEDSSTQAPERPTQTQYVEPALGMATTTIEDVGGLALSSSTKYEDVDGAPNHFLRRIGRTLPGGNSYKYEYYGNTQVVDNPCTTASDPVNQGGALSKTWAASPADSTGTGENTGLPLLRLTPNSLR